MEIINLYGGNMEDKNGKSIKIFLILSFTLPLISLILIKFIPFFQKGIPYFVLYGFEAITPSISALLVICILYGKKGTLSFLKKSYVENKKVKYILLAFLLPLIIGLFTYILCVIFIDLPILNINVDTNEIIVLLWALVAEELGWRGFLQENLNNKLDKKVIPLIIGITWSLWHYHFFLLETISAPIILFTISCIIDSYIYYGLTTKSEQNIISASIFHFMGNLLFSVLLIYPNYYNGNTLPYIFYIISSFIVMICFVKCESFNKRER